jgi:hypothetical protein
VRPSQPGSRCCEQREQDVAKACEAGHLTGAFTAAPAGQVVKQRRRSGRKPNATAVLRPDSVKA